mmetsp:Transcript_966/g.1725  ORF Transcript_966/g.1725 Transcript_966/m.1725 type:complete len:191 (+) Transcript_966:386-958(+)
MLKIEKARQMEPMLTGQDESMVLHSPNTAVVDIHACLATLNSQVSELNPNYEILFGEQFAKKVDGQKQIVTQNGTTIEYKHLINSAGQQALEIAQHFGKGDNLDIFPMKGLYCMSKEPLNQTYHKIVYPIPLKGAYTLGVHSTMTPDGHMKIGPTTSPAFSLEMYRGFENFKLSDLKNIIRSYGIILRSK